MYEINVPLRSDLSESGGAHFSTLSFAQGYTL